jgi:hypothetical protein
MQDDTSTSPKVPFLLRRVTVPSWLQTILLVVVAYCFVNLLITRPELLVLALIGSILFVTLVRNPLRRHAGQDPEKDAQEIREAPDQESAAMVAWRQFRTYQVWHLTLIAIGFVLVVLDLVGVPTP